MAASGLDATGRKRNALKRLFVRAAFTLFALASLTLTAWSENPSPINTVVIPVTDNKEIRFNHLSIAEGLSQTRVQQIVQDDRGFIWLGTQYGLNRYDGYTYRVFTHDPANPDSLSGVYIRALFKDRNGYLWVACDQALDRFDPATEKFKHYSLRPASGKGPDSTVSQITQDSEGTLWFSTPTGLYSITRDDGKMRRYNHNPNDPKSISSDDVQVTSEDTQGRFWVGERDGFDELDRKTSQVIRHVAVPDTYADLQMQQDRFGHYWIVYGRSGEIGQLDMETGLLTKYLPDPQVAGNRLSRITYAMMKDRDQNMWFGTSGNGLLRFDDQKKTFIRYKNRSGDFDSLSADRVTTLFEDRDGNIWVGLHAVEPDFFTLKKPPFESFQHMSGSGNSLISNLVTSIYKDRSGDLWIGTTGALQRIESRTGNYTEVSHPFRGTDVLAIVQDKDGTYWFATTSYGLVRLDRKTGKVRIYRHDPADPTSIVSDLVERLLIDHNGTLWAATWDGLSRFDGKTQHFTSYVASPGGGNENYYAIAEDPEGKLWLGSNFGLERFDPATKQFQSYRHVQNDIHGLSDSRVNSIYFDKTGQGWIGTQNGLDKLNVATGRFTNYFDRDGLSGNVVSCIQGDGAGHLWMGTNKGITEIDLRTLRFSAYSHEDGLPGDDLTGWGACSQSPDGEMFFGGFSGGTAFFPGRVQERPYLPAVRLSEFRVNGNVLAPGGESPLKQALNYTDRITLRHKQNIFSISFAALSYSNAATNRYRYKLDGLDTDWHNVDSKQRTASYTTLPAGSYTFHVQAATSRGQWNSPAAILRIEVLPAWWNRWWFRGCYSAVVLLILFGFYRYRLHQLAQGFKDRLEERIKERTRIARELHDTLLQSFYGLVLSFDAAIRVIPPEMPSYGNLKSALDRADKALAEGRDRVSGLRMGTDDLSDLGTRLGMLLEEMKTHCNATFTLRTVGSLAEYDGAVCGELYQIAKEALMNAALHSGASTIVIAVTASPLSLRLEVIDSGRGIDPELLHAGGRPGHWGMTGMRERARQIGSKIRIVSTPGAGTSVSIEVPMTQAKRANLPA